MKKVIYFLCFLIGGAAAANAQCTNASSYGSATAPSTVGSTVTISGCNFQSEYSTVSGIVAGNVYQATYSLGGCITVHSGSYNGPVVAFGSAPLSFTATVSGTYYIHYSLDCTTCATATSCGTSAISLTSTSAPSSGCTNSSAYGSATAPTTVGSTVTISSCTFQSEYNTISNIVAGNVYTANYSLGGCITVHSGSYNGPVVSFGNAPLTFTATVSGTYYIHYNTSCSTCGTASSCGTSSIALTSGASSGSGCTNTSAYGSATAPSTSGSTVTISSCTFQSEYNTISNIVAGSVYTANYSLGGCITVHSGSYNGPVVAFGNAPLTFTATVSGTYYIHYNTDCVTCGTASSCGTSSLALGTSAGGGGCVGGSNNTCATADPFCTGTSYNYCNSTGVASMGSYDCLYTTPNPMWMYLNVQTSGSIDMQINQYNTAGTGIDVDFALYGPYSNSAAGCPGISGTTTTVDCSYSSSYTEYVSVPSAVAGQWYMLLITNYNGSAGYIQFSQTGGSATTNCSIVLPIDLESFDASHSAGANLLSWKCLSENNNDYFVVERSANGVDFEQVSVVDGAGNSASPTYYQFTDNSFFKNSINYYRLKQVDFNNGARYSEIIHVDNRSSDAPVVVRRVDMLGRDIDPLSFKGIYIEYFSDGTVRKSCCNVNVD